MNRFFPFLLLLCLTAALLAGAQTAPPLQPEQDACGALDVCGSTFYTPYSYTGSGVTQEQSQLSGACFDESNSVWLKLTVATAGTINFTITPVNTSNDYDFAVFNITGLPCNSANNSTRIRCNGCDINSSPGGITGLSPSGSGTVSGPGFGPNFIAQINASVGDVYLILIDNFNTGAGVAGFTVDFSASTATFVQAPLPQLAALLPSCSYAQQVTVTTNVPVKCSSIAADGSDFTVTGGGGGTVTSATGLQCSGGAGYTNTIFLTFGSQLPPGTYSLNVQNGTDGNTLLNLCDNALIPPAALAFTVLPYAPPAFITPDTPACLALRVRLTRPIACSTVAEDGSDFIVSGPSAVQVINAVPHSCINGLTDTLDLFFSQPITTPGTYTLASQQGTDGNGLVDTCGVALSNTTSWVVSDRGFVFATASPALLCQPGYVALNTTITTPPPSPGLPNCGTTNAPAYTPAYGHYAGNPGFGGAYQPSPFQGNYSDARTQMIFTAAELQATGMTAGIIRRLALDVAQRNTTLPYTNLTIKIGCTPQADLSSGIFIAGLTPVFSSPAYMPTDSLNYFALQQPYSWDGASNLAVEICYDNTASGFLPDLVRASPAFTASVLQAASNAGSGCTLTTGVTYSNRPNVIFYESTPPPYNGYGAVWTPGDLVGDSSATNTTAYVHDDTQWQVQIMDNKYCYRRDTTSVRVSKRFPALAPGTDTAICPGQSVLLSAGGGASYEWYPSAGLSCTTCPDPIATPTQTTTYYVSVMSADGCADTLSRTIIIYPPPIVNAGRDTTIIYGQSAQLQAFTPGGAVLLWSPVGSLSDPAIPNPVATPVATTTYAIRVIDTNGCANGDTVTVTVLYDSPLEIPTAFTPNGDGHNDVFHIAYPGIKRLGEFRIFNRWGRQIFSTTNIADGWDGTYNGVQQDMGVYNYLIRVTWPDGRAETLHGTVTLVR